MALDLEEMKRDIGLSAADGPLLRAARPWVKDAFEGIVDGFYETLMANPKQRAVFEDEAQIERQKEHLSGWLFTLFDGTYDTAYFARRSRIGRVHVAIGLPSRYMTSMLGVLRASLLDALRAGAEREGATGERLVETERALLRLLDLELLVMLESYHEDASRQLQAKERLATLGQLATAIGLDVAQRAGGSGQTMILGLDSEGVVRFCNDTAKRYGGAALLEVPELAAAVEGARQGAPDPVRVEVSVGDQTRHVRFTFATMDGTSGVVLLALGTDISDERRAQRLSAEREALAAVGLLTAGLAHEIRNPLNAATLQLHLLRRRVAKLEESGSTVEKIDIVERELARLTTLLNDFLNLARPEAKTHVPVSLDEVLRRVLLLTEPFVAQFDISIHRVGDGGVWVRGDAPRIEQVLLNLIGNAREAMTGLGPGTIEVRIERVGGMVKLVVEDEGPGLEGDNSFEPFVTSKAAGTGLGLAIVQKIVQLHGGEVGLESRGDRRGARAWFTLVEVTPPRPRDPPTTP